MSNLKKNSPFKRGEAVAGIADWLNYGSIARAGQPVDLTGEGVIQLGALFSQLDFKPKGAAKDDVEDEVKKAVIGEVDDGEEFDPNKVRVEDEDELPDLDKLIIKKQPKQQTTVTPPKTVEEEVTVPTQTEYTAPEKLDYYPEFSQSQVEEFMKTDIYKNLGQLGKQKINRALITIRGKGKDVNATNIYAGTSMPDEFFKYMNMPIPLAEGKNAQRKEVFTQDTKKFLFDQPKEEQGLIMDAINAISGNNIDTSQFERGELISRRDFNSLSLNQRKAYIAAQGLDWAGKNADYSTVLNRIKPEILDLLQGIRYKNKGSEDTPLRRIMHAVHSPFLKTDDLNYRSIKQAVMPSYARGRLGAAAAEGFNLVIDKYNYDQKVRAEYDKELDDEMGSLVVEPEFVSDTARKNYLEFSLGKKKKAAEAFNDYANGRISKLEYENKKASIKSEIDQAATARTNLAKIRKEFVENKGKYDIGASKSSMVDFYNTLEKNPEALSIVNKDGVDYIVGTTKGNKFIQVPTSKIADGTAGFRLVEKASMSPIVNGALKAIDGYREEIKTRYGIGTATADPEKAKEIGVNFIKSQLKDETKLRSMMSQIFGVDHSTYQQFVEGNEKLSAEMLDDAAKELYDMSVGPQYFPQKKTTKVMQPKGGSSTAGERERARIKTNFDRLAPLSSDTLSGYASQLDKSTYELKEDPKGGFYINDLKNKRRINLPSDPSEAKTEIAGFAGVRGYSGPTYDATSLIQKYSK